MSSGRQGATEQVERKTHGSAATSGVKAPPQWPRKLVAQHDKPARHSRAPLQRAPGPFAAGLLVVCALVGPLGALDGAGPASGAGSRCVGGGEALFGLIGAGATLAATLVCAAELAGSGLEWAREQPPPESPASHDESTSARLNEPPRQPQAPGRN